MDNNQYLLQMRNISKSFRAVNALRNVDLELYSGEVLSLLGENGAGKSTLIKVLSGAYRADGGEILINGEVQSYTTPSGANEKGISVIYQELNYMNDLTVAENFCLNRWPQKKSGAIDWKKLHNDAAEVLKSLNVDIDTHSMMNQLSVAEKQLVEIAKSLSQDVKILVMDEPTAALSDNEVERLVQLVGKLRNEGKGIIFITHRMDEIFLIADRVLVMRDGERVALVETKQASREKLIELMVGRTINVTYPKRQIPIDKDSIILSVDNLTTSYLKDISFQLRKGEILGMFGLMGSGRTELAECIFGAHTVLTADIELNGKKLKIRNPSEAIKQGIGYVTAERKKDGVILSSSITNNIMLASLNNYKHPLKINEQEDRATANAWKAKMNIKAPSVDVDVGNLSGGNQQKVILAKWLNTNPKVLILNEPTRGIDVGAKTEIYNLMEDFCESGVGVIMISSDLPEILQLSDRVVVLCEGRQTKIHERNELSQEVLMKSAIGEG